MTTCSICGSKATHEFDISLKELKEAQQLSQGYTELTNITQQSNGKFAVMTCNDENCESLFKQIIPEYKNMAKTKIGEWVKV